MADLGGWPLLTWCAERLKTVQDGAATVVVATSTNQDDDRIASHTTLSLPGTILVRGDAADVLSRFALALATTDSPLIVRVTGDCPLIDPGIIDAACELVASTGADYASTSIDGRFARGLDVEVMTRAALERAVNESTTEEHHEHVTPFIYQNPDIFKCVAVPAPSWAAHPNIRITVDEAEDLELLRHVVAQLAPTTPTALSARSVVEHLRANPGLASLNSAVEHRIVRNVAHERHSASTEGTNRT